MGIVASVSIHHVLLSFILLHEANRVPVFGISTSVEIQDKYISLMPKQTGKKRSSSRSAQPTPCTHGIQYMPTNKCALEAQSAEICRTSDPGKLSRVAITWDVSQPLGTRKRSPATFLSRDTTLRIHSSRRSSEVRIQVWTKYIDNGDSHNNDERRCRPSAGPHARPAHSPALPPPNLGPPQDPTRHPAWFHPDAAPGGTPPEPCEEGRKKDTTGSPEKKKKGRRAWRVVGRAGGTHVRREGGRKGTWEQKRASDEMSTPPSPPKRATHP